MCVQIPAVSSCPVLSHPAIDKPVSSFPQLFVGSYHARYGIALLALASPRSTPCGTGVHPAHCAVRLRTCRGGGRGPELPILVRSPQPAVLAAALIPPNEKRGARKEKRSHAENSLTSGPLLHHQQPLSRRPALTHPLPPSPPSSFASAHLPFSLPTLHPWAD